MNESAALELIGMASEFADCAQDNVDDITHLDVLDNLAGTGLTLTHDLVGLAAYAYQLELKKIAAPLLKEEH